MVDAPLLLCRDIVLGIFENCLRVAEWDRTTGHLGQNKVLSLVCVSYRQNSDKFVLNDLCGVKLGMRIKLTLQ